MDINQIKNFIREGRVSSVDPVKCTARVTFPDRDDMVSAELPVLTMGSRETKVYWMPAIDAQVVCIFAPNASGKGLKEGYILGCRYSTQDTPAESSADVLSFRFKDGSFIRVDNGTIEIHASSAIKLTAPRVDIN